MEFWFLNLQIPTIVALSLAFIGWLSALLPILPGSLIIWGAILLHKLWVPDFLSLQYLIITGLLALLAQVLDYLCTYWGARHFGATWRGGLGALLGMIFFSIVLTPFIGLMIGPPLGAVLFELISGRPLKCASKAGIGTIVGGLLAFFIKFFIASLLFASFAYVLIA